jgi:lipopolysaccharide export system protein LptA
MSLKMRNNSVVSYLRFLFVSGVFALCASIASAQSTNVTFGAMQGDPTLPVEITSQTLDVDQKAGTAEFNGDVIVAQGEMRLSADKVLVIYNEQNSAIDRVQATGDVVLVSGPDAAESDRADYTIDDGVVVMTGDVLLTQGPNALTSERMVVNLVTGEAKMTGRVKTIILPGTTGSDN